MKKLLCSIIKGILWIRQILFLAYFVVIDIIFSIINVILRALRLPYAVRSFSVYLQAWLNRLGILIFLWIRIKIEGKHNIPKQPCIFVSKHQSELETYVLHTMIWRCVYVMKKELMQIPVIGWNAKALEFIPIDRSAGVKAYKEVIKSGKDRLARGISIIVFPEGTRVPPKTHPRFHKSAMSLASVTESLVVPIAHNSGSLWQPKKPVKPGKVTFVFGEPIQADKDVNKIMDKTHQWIKNQMEKIE